MSVQESVYVVIALFTKENRVLRNNDNIRIPPGFKTIRNWRRGDSWKPGSFHDISGSDQPSAMTMMWSDFNNRFRQALQNPYDELRANCEFHALTYIKYCISLRLRAYKFQESCCLETLDEF